LPNLEVVGIRTPNELDGTIDLVDESIHFASQKLEVVDFFAISNVSELSSSEIPSISITGIDVLLAQYDKTLHLLNLTGCDLSIQDADQLAAHPQMQRRVPSSSKVTGSLDAAAVWAKTQTPSTWRSFSALREHWIDEKIHSNAYKT
jgi:hypothetical protein